MSARADGPCRAFWQDTGATAAVEFALVAVPLLALAFMILETALVIISGALLDNAAQQIARLIQTGQAQQMNIVTADDFRTRLICPSVGTRNLPIYFGCNNLLVDVRTSASMSAADLSNDFYTTGSKFCMGGPQSIVILRIIYVLPSFFPILSFLPSGALTISRAGLVDDVPGFAGWYHLVSNATMFQNESYGGSASCS